MLVDFIYNMAIIIVYVLLVSRIKEHLVKKKMEPKKMVLIITFVSSFFSYLAMLRPIQIANMLFDFRVIPIFLVSYIFGWKYGLISGILPAGYRLYLGGDAAWLGVILDILLAVFIGGIFSRDKKNLEFVFLNKKRVVEVFFIVIISYFSPFLLFDKYLFFTWIELLTLYTIFSIGTLTVAVALVNDVNKSIYKNTVEFDHLDKKLDQSKMTIKLFGQLSHELKTPLNLTFSALHMVDINLSLNNMDKSKLRQYTEIIRRNNFRLLKLVNNMVDITKIKSDSFKLNLQNIDIIQIIEETVYSSEKYIRNKNRILKFNTEVKEIIIACDPIEMERVVLNLLSNAVKFTKKGDIIEININANQNNVYISVRDSGVGIKTKDQEEIFNAFGQVDKTFSRNQEGSGLGLTIVKEIIEMHGGEISVDSEYGSGSNFIIKLPIKILSEEELDANRFSQFYEENINRVKVEFSDIYDD